MNEKLTRPSNDSKSMVVRPGKIGAVAGLNGYRYSFLIIVTLYYFMGRSGIASQIPDLEQQQLRDYVLKKYPAALEVLQTRYSQIHAIAREVQERKSKEKTLGSASKIEIFSKNNNLKYIGNESLSMNNNRLSAHPGRNFSELPLS